MNKVSVFYSVVALLTSMVFCSSTGHAEEMQIPKCDEKWCFNVAQPLSPWPSAHKGETVIIEDGPQILAAIPNGFTKVWRSGYSVHYFYENKKAITFNQITLDIFPDLKSSSAGSNFTIHDIWRTIFTKTPKDNEPKRPKDALRWKWAISCMKKFYFRGESPVFFSKNGPLTVYYLGGLDGLKTRNAAIILNDKNRDMVLEIISTNINFENFKQMIGSITLKDTGTEQ
jgi:hypothetical protein